jgi:bacterioferritin
MHKQSIGILNEAVADEMSAIHQYMFFHIHCDDQGYDPLANLFKQTAITEMLHTERLAERILFLKGEVEMAASAPVEKIHDVGQMLQKALQLEEETVKLYNRFAQQ